jgi:sterol desaturase/sphingolipid hydroxylase (fatty acid hydroxylase superfamily)
MDFSVITSPISNAYASVQEFLFANVLGPILYQFDLMSFAEDAFDGMDWFLFGCIQIALIILVLRTWERWAPAEAQEQFSKSSRADVLYTLFHRLGIFHGFIFIVLSGFFFEVDSILHDFRFDRLNVESWWPGVTSIPMISFVVYLVLLDFVEYLYHRASHTFNWWWQLHALHHSQTVMTAWSDNRSHILDDIMRASVFSFFALLFGVQPGQFIILVAVSQFIQSWQHANIKVDLGTARYFFISPMFHRMHHAVGYGHEAKGKPGVLGGCNFGILFPWWDIAFKTAIYPDKVYPTGVRNLAVSQNIFVQQWQGLVHAVREVLPK